MNKNECLTANWQNVGFEDGASGFGITRIGMHRKACSRYGVSPDLEAYGRGHADGVRQWCTPGNGYYQGTRGTVYNGVCPPELEDDFILAINKGGEIFQLQQQMDRAESDLSYLYGRLDDLEREIGDLEAELVVDGVTPRRRNRLLDEIREVEDQRDELLFDISDVKHELADLEVFVDSLRDEHARNHPFAR